MTNTPDKTIQVLQQVATLVGAALGPFLVSWVSPH